MDLYQVSYPLKIELWAQQFCYKGFVWFAYHLRTIWKKVLRFTHNVLVNANVIQERAWNSFAFFLHLTLIDIRSFGKNGTK